MTETCGIPCELTDWGISVETTRMSRGMYFVLDCRICDQSGPYQGIHPLDVGGWHRLNQRGRCMEGLQDNQHISRDLHVRATAYGSPVL